MGYPDRNQASSKRSNRHALTGRLPAEASLRDRLGKSPVRVELLEPRQLLSAVAMATSETSHVAAAIQMSLSSGTVTSGLLNTGSPSAAVTAAGASLVADLNAGPADSSPGPIVATSSGLVFFGANDGVPGLWVTDGTAAHTTRLTAAAQSFKIDQLVAIGGNVVFASNSQVWCSDGTVAGTVLLANGFKPDLTPFKGKIYFLSANGLQSTDGTLAGTIYTPVALPPATVGLSAAGNYLYIRNAAYTGYDFLHSAGMYSTDGTSPIPTLIVGFIPGLQHPPVPPAPVFVAGSAYFPFNGSYAETDGTSSYSGRLLPSSAGFPTPVSPITGDTTPYFIAGTGLWISDGTGSGTQYLAPITGIPS